MMEGVMAVITVGISVLMLTWILKVLNWVWLRPKKLERYLRRQGFSGNRYRVLVGDMSESNRMDKEAHSQPLDSPADLAFRMMPFIRRNIRKYGKRCFTWYGPYPNVVITEPEILREILSRHEVFPKPKIGSHSHVFLSGLPDHEGEKWSKHRSLLNPAFRIDHLKNMMPAFSQSCEEMVKEWDSLAGSKGSVELDSWPYCLEISRSTLARATFGGDYEEGKKIFTIQQEQIDLGLRAIRSVYIPGSRFLPTKFNRRLKQTEVEMRIMFKTMIERKEKEMKNADASAVPTDLLSSMLAANSKLIQEQGTASGLTMEDLIDDCKAFYLAGQNVTSSLFVWTLVVLGQHPDWQDRARDEVLRVFGPDNTPDFNGLNRLKIIPMILQEVLRLYSPAYFTCRITHKEIKLETFTLPAGVIITLPMLLIHHDADLWGPDTGDFKPERFSGGVSVATNGRLSFLPFSSGPRTCIGQNFTMVESKVFVSMILQRFRIETSPHYIHAPFPRATTVPQHGAHLILHRL